MVDDWKQREVGGVEEKIVRNIEREKKRRGSVWKAHIAGGSAYGDWNCQCRDGSLWAPSGFAHSKQQQ